jgi:hypothetical protein
MSGKNGPTERHDRDGQRLVSAYMHPDIHRAIRIAAATEGTTNVALLHEGAALVLARHGYQIPKAAVDYLADHHRPLPEPTPPSVTGKAKPKGNPGPR